MARDPTMDGLACDAHVLGDFGDLPPVLKDRHDRLIALIHDTNLH
jgi:hypothetical protein